MDANLIALLGLYRAVRRNESPVDDEFWNICIRGSGEGSEGKDGQPLEDQHDSG